MQLKRFLFLVFFLTLFLLRISPLFAVEKIKIVTTTSTLASLVNEITHEKAEVYFIASPNRDIHFIGVTPKDIVKVKKADVFIHQGLDLEAWRPPLLEAVGRLDFLHVGEKAIDVSRGIPLLEVPTSLSRIQGDIHAFGNPHYWIDPLNAKIMAQNISEELAKIYPEDTDFFQKNFQEFSHKLDEKMKEWQNQISPYKGSAVIIYHNTWPYFMERFGLVIVGYLEPKPGIPPTAKHIEELTQIMKEKNVKVIVKEVFHESRAPKSLAKKTGAVIVTLDTEVGEIKGDYFTLIDYNIRELVQAFQNQKP
jgi:ABC-type Zn uptake system ZnuABC Zn-binding protein ZnuA